MTDGTSDAEKLTIELVKAGATREKVVAIIDGYGDVIDWSGWTLKSIVGEVWNSDANSGSEPDNYIINDICSHFGLEQVK